jgi:hypothetical protein
MSERERPRTRDEVPAPEGLGNPFAIDGGAAGTVTIDYGVYREQLPLAGRTVAEIRRIVGPRYDIDPRSITTVNGDASGEDTVVRAGQELRFMHISGEKGQGELPLGELLGGAPDDAVLQHLLASRRRRGRDVPQVVIENRDVAVTSPEGRTKTMRLEALLAHLERGGPSAQDARDLVLPDGIKWVTSRGAHTILVHQTPPAVHHLKWIAADSPARHGQKTTYRQVRLALPYLIVFALFEPRPDGQLRLGGANECFFRNEPLRSPDDKLCYPALLNCSKFEEPEKPLSWICTQHLVRTRLPASAGINERVRQGMVDLMHCMLQTGFNYSSDEHELSSWFTESTGVDPRVSTVEAWENATGHDPMFVTEVPWLEVGKSVREVAERSLTRHAGRAGSPRTSYDVARVVYNHGTLRKDKKKTENNDDQDGKSDP